MTILDDARAALATGSVCDACLGRAFADRSYGLTNPQRGRALRTTIALDDDEPYESPDDCWVCEGHSFRYDEWADRVVDALDGIAFETYQVGTRVPPLIEENDALLREDTRGDRAAGEPFKSGFNREVGKRVGAATGAAVDFDRPDVVALAHVERGTVEVQVNPAFVYGRYRKLERDVPQTEWPCTDCGGTGIQMATDGSEEDCDGCDGSGYRYDRSVEGLTAPIVREAMDGTEAVFHGAGREDVDALMVGTGRPFVIEVKRPRDRFPDLAAVEAEINDHAAGTVEVERLRPATHEMVERVKELPASKTYRMDVTLGEPVTDDELAEAIEELDGATIEQHTPHRVDHRRASRTRTREVYDIEGTLHEPTRAELEVHGEGGLYVKELVSGDDGRTEPSLAGLLGVDAEVTALDVFAVESEAEPFATEEYLRTPA